jgi:hypothetical protein
VCQTHHALVAAQPIVGNQVDGQGREKGYLPAPRRIVSAVKLKVGCQGNIPLHRISHSKRRRTLGDDAELINVAFLVPWGDAEARA